VLTGGELDERAALVDELARWAVDRIPARPADDEIATTG
jgi:hypothetical protein